MSKHTTLQRLRRMLELEQLHFPKGSERAAELVAKIERQRLAAAAPELLAALRGLLEATELAGFDGPPMEAARAAIAKAEGGAA